MPQEYVVVAAQGEWDVTTLLSNVEEFILYEDEDGYICLGTPFFQDEAGNLVLDMSAL